MHEVGILDAVCERATRRRGGIAVFDHLNPRQTAHIVVDLQNGFMGQGQVAEVPMARTIVPNVNSISAARCGWRCGLSPAHDGCGGGPYVAGLF